MNNRNKTLKDTHLEVTKNIKDIKDSCEQHLTYLTDKGFRVKVDWLQNNFYQIQIDNKSRLEFEWGDVKIDFIPFISIIQNEYGIYDDSIDFGRSNIKVNRVLDDLIINFYKIHNITIIICL